METPKQNESSTEPKRLIELHEHWIREQLTLLAESLRRGAPSPTGIAMHAKALADIPQPTLAAAMDRALKECDWFPSPKQLRDLALGDSEDRALVEAEAAWNWILEVMHRHWQADMGFYQSAPKIPERISYALRQVGGMTILAQMENSSVPFIKRDFVAAYQRQPIAEQHTAAIAAMLPPVMQRQAKRLAGEKSIDRPKVEEINEARVRLAENRFRAAAREEKLAAEKLEHGRQRAKEQIEWLIQTGKISREEYEATKFRNAEEAKAEAATKSAGN